MIEPKSLVAASRGQLRFGQLREKLRSDEPLFPHAMRANIAWRRNQLYVKSEKLLALLSSGGAKKVLFSGNPDWAEDIKKGFERLPHQIEFGPITEDSFERYDIVVPLSIPAQEAARQHCPLQKRALPLPTAESVRLCEDKYEFNQALIHAGFAPYIPKMAQGRELIPPYILKKRIGWWGAGCYIIRNRDDEEAQLNRITDSEYFCQEFIPGSTEFATHILFVDGKIVKALNIKYEFPVDMPIKGQDADRLKVIHRCPYLDLFARVLRTIQFEGLCCVNYKVLNGQMFLLEINPRFGGSLSPYFFSFVRHLR
jgi:predicted ATP-grasp superfamily ATP-dependent carboligase